MTTAINVTKLRKNLKIKFRERFSINAFSKAKSKKQIEKRIMVTEELQCHEKYYNEDIERCNYLISQRRFLAYITLEKEKVHNPKI